MARRARHISRLYRHDGFAAVIWEFMYQALKPAIRVYERWLWHRYTTQHRTCFRILGSDITVHVDDSGVSQELAVHRFHEPLATRLLQQTLRPGMTVVDVGSNIGYYALLEARLVGPAGKVFAIEPVPKNAALLRANVQLNSAPNIDLHELAIGDRTGTVPAYLSSNSNWHSLLPTPAAETVWVAVKTLDDFVCAAQPASVDLIRMDVEGYEIQILSGMHQTLRKYGPRMLVELHPAIVGGSALVAYLNTLESLGYIPEWAFEQERDSAVRWRFIKPEHPTMAELMRDGRIVRDLRPMTVLFAPQHHVGIQVNSAECDQVSCA